MFLPALLPSLPMVLVLYALEHVIKPLSLPSIMVVAGTGLCVYLIGYLSWGASEAERETCRSFALSTARFAVACFKRS